MQQLHPICLTPAFHETLWGGRKLAEAGWKQLPAESGPIGESWETEVSTLASNAPYARQTLGQLVETLGTDLLGTRAEAVFGGRFPLLAKFIDARKQLSVQVHPTDEYADRHAGGKLGKTECWYILQAEPGASIIHGFRAPTTRAAVQQAIAANSLETLLREVPVVAGDVIFVPAGTVHAIGSGVLLYELQEYSDVTYRLYDYGRLDAQGRPRELHIARSLDVAHYGPSSQVKTRAVTLNETPAYTGRCLVACRYFVLNEFTLRTHLADQTDASCVILTALAGDLHIRYGPRLALDVQLTRGQTLILPAALGAYRVEGAGTLLSAYVPDSADAAWRLWSEQNS